MGRRRTSTYKHPLWEFMLLMAADAEQTGITENEARNLIRKWMPSMAPHVDTVLAEMGETTMIPEAATKATFEAINREEVAFTRAQIDRALQAANTPEATANASAETTSESFSAQLRGEFGAKRNKSGRATVEG